LPKKKVLNDGGEGQDQVLRKEEKEAKSIELKDVNWSNPLKSS
jgi:hypothetical protein